MENKPFIAIFVFVLISFIFFSLVFFVLYRSKVSPAPVASEGSTAATTPTLEDPLSPLQPTSPALSFIEERLADGPPLVTRAENEEPATVYVEVGIAGIAPEEFAVSPGEKVTLRVDGGDICQFIREGQESIVTMMSLNTTAQESIYTASFYAPDITDTYAISCNVPGHALLGIEGTMIVE